MSRTTNSWMGGLEGSPELVIEIISPSNRTDRDVRTALLCLRNGAQQLWLVDMQNRSVLVLSGDNAFTTYETGARIPLPRGLGGGEIALDDIFPASGARESPLS